MELQVEFSRGAPLRRQLERHIRDAIRQGSLRVGTRLPASRVLAEQLGVSRGVVVDAYAQLQAEGYLAAWGRAGTVVAYEPSPASVAGLRSSERKIRYDLRPGQPDLASFPRRRWLAAIERTMRDLPVEALTYGEPWGRERLRRAVSEYVGRRRAVIADPEDVVICSGLAHGLTTIWLALRNRGARRVAVECPGWRWQSRTVEEAGLTPVPVRVDEAGLVVSELERADVDAVVLTPAHQFPTGVALSRGRRSALLAWARDRKALVVEDDCDAEFQFDGNPMPALQSLAPDCVVYCASASKTLIPALRLAWMVVPGTFVEDLHRPIGTTMSEPSVLVQDAAAWFLEQGELDRHLRRTEKLYRRRRAALVDALGTELPQLSVGGAAAGLHVIAWIGDGPSDEDIAAEARRHGVAVHALHRHCTAAADTPQALILGYANTHEAGLRRAVVALGRVFA